MDDGSGPDLARLMADELNERARGAVLVRDTGDRGLIEKRRDRFHGGPLDHPLARLVPGHEAVRIGLDGGVALKLPFRAGP